MMSAGKSRRSKTPPLTRAARLVISGAGVIKNALMLHR